MHLNILSSLDVDGVSVLQFQTVQRDTFEFLTSVRALAQKLVTVTEINKSGDINRLRAENHAPQPVFFMDGDVLIGAKQTRVLNTSLLLAARSVTILPVSCVEAGRWHSNSDRFDMSPLAAPPSLRAVKSDSSANRRARAHHLANQAKVWSRVAQLKTSHRARAVSDSLHDIYLERQARVEKALESLQHAPGANAVAFLHNGRFLSVDIFHRTDALADYLLRLARGALLDVIAEPPTQSAAATEAEDPLPHLGELLTGAVRNASSPRASAALGFERRFVTRGCSGFILEHEAHLIHLAMAAF